MGCCSASRLAPMPSVRFLYSIPLCAVFSPRPVVRWRGYVINRRRQYLFLCLLILPRVSNLFSVKGGCQKRSIRLPSPEPSGAVIEGMGGLSRSGSEEGNSPGERCGEVDAAQLPIPIDVIEWTGTVGRKAIHPPLPIRARSSHSVLHGIHNEASGCARRRGKGMSDRHR